MQASAPETEDAARQPKRKRATLYDAVAGRVGYEGFLRPQVPSRYRDTADTSASAVPPDEVLFRRKNAPDRYIEDDAYRAERHLPDSQRLPDSDLLKSIHTYASKYYANATEDHGKNDFRSLDETALLAMAILLEEAASHAIGESGDLAFVETSDRRGPAFQKLPTVRKSSARDGKNRPD